MPIIIKTLNDIDQTQYQALLTVAFRYSRWLLAEECVTHNMVKFVILEQIFTRLLKSTALWVQWRSRYNLLRIFLSVSLSLPLLLPTPPLLLKNSASTQDSPDQAWIYHIPVCEYLRGISNAKASAVFKPQS